MEMIVARGLEDPEDGFGLQQAVLEEVSSGARGPTALAWTSPRYVAATRPETRLPGFARAARSAESAGFPVLVRNSGGGAVAANEGSVSFSLTFPVADLRHGLYERYDEGLEIIAAALGRVGVAAEAGEVEREFCPGTYSVRSGGSGGVKHAGLAQRVTRRAARMEALILVSRTAELAATLTDFYEALGLPFRPGSVGDLPATVPRVLDALRAELAERPGSAGAIPERGATEALLEKARSLRGTWRADPSRTQKERRP